MPTFQDSKSFRHFVKHLFIVGKVYGERNKAKESVYKHLELMRKSIIKMRLSYTDIDILKEKIDNLFDLERKYVKFFKLEDNETNDLKKQLNSLHQELANEKTEKQRIIEENNEKINQLTNSLDNIKNQMKHLLMEKAKRHQRLTALDKKIREKVDVHKYYH